LKRLAFFLLAVVLVGSFFFIFGKKKERKIVPVETWTVRKDTVRQIVKATGTIKPQVGAEVKVGARISGTVIKEFVKVGDWVKKGQLIAIIDNRELKEELKKARANLKAVKEKYKRLIKEKELKVKEKELELRSCKQELEAKKTNYEVKKWEYEREKRLFEKGYSTKKKLKRAKNELERAKSELVSAKEKLKKAKLEKEIAEKELERVKIEYEKELKIAKAQLEQAKVRYSYSFIYAPMSGVISFVSTQEGETVVAGLNAPQFVSILDPSKLENWIYVDETEIGKIKKGMEVEFTVDTYPNRVFKAKIEEIYPKAKIWNNVVYYIAVARGFPPNVLRPEMTTHNKIIAGKREGLVVPKEAVKWKNGRFVVYKVEGKKVVEVPVSVGWTDERYTEILEGLKEGDVVATKVEVK